ncbi:ribonuclease HII [Cellulophaga sp. E16_2]|uniref:ribonuclease HII n=1 Tax=Cellulophaga sp. E16_2 TaxID=2789297 RepID=UPI001A91CC1E|nr:ribonuclease HII [Cellulophaga sp. E16_2]MBO0590558.1 ribonuclease HII [Cellulophaga sp. E16_2]
MKLKVCVFFIIVFLSCKKEASTSSSLLNHIPQNASILIKINDYDLFISDLKNNAFIKEYQQTPHYSESFKYLKLLSYIKPGKESIISFIEVGKGKLDYLFKTKSSSTLLNLKDIKNKTVEELTYENYSFTKATIEDQLAYIYKDTEYTFISSSQLLIENLIRNKEIPDTDLNLKKLYDSSGKSNSAVLFFNTKYCKELTSSLKETNHFDLSEFSDWISLDAIVKQNEFKLTGISICNEGNHSKFASLFSNVSPVLNKTQFYAPINAQYIISYTFKNFENYYKNQQKYLEALPKKDTTFQAVQELGIIGVSNEKVVLIQTFDATHLVDILNQNSNETINYQGNEILKLIDVNFLAPFKAILPNFKTNYATIVEEVIIFSENLAPLQNTISNYKNEATFNKSEIYSSAKTSIADESNILFISSPEGIANFREHELKEDISKQISALDFSNQIVIGQLVSDKGFFHSSVILKKITEKTESNLTAPLYTVQLDHNIASEPQFVKNYLTKKKEIIVQDVKNILYLISTEGKVVWKKQLEGKIKGEIIQVDLYKNGRLQFAFTTDNQFLIIDRNGTIVKPFNLTFDSAELNSLSVFDYDNNRNYRFIITEKSNISMFDNSGKLVNGFNFKDTGKTITKAPKHFRFNKKDYITFPEEDGTLRILSRVGADRITVKEKIAFSDNEVYNFENKFTVTDNKGTLVQIDEKGNIEKKDLKLSKDHTIDASTNTLAVMNENTLMVKGKEIALELGLYSKPKLFYNNDKLYVSVTDLQNQKIYLFDSNLNPIQNFPVFGNSSIDLVDMDNDKKLEFVAKDQENSIIVYRIN